MSDGKYTKYFFVGVVLLFLFGLVLPWMISAPSDVEVIVGVLVILGVTYGVGLFLKHAIEDKEKK